MAKGLKGSFFDNASTDSDEEGVISGFDAADLAIPMGDEEEDEDQEEEEEEEVQPKKRKVVEEEEELEEEEEESEEDQENDQNEDDISEINRVALDLIDKGVLQIDEDKEYSDSEVGLADMIEDTVEVRLRERITPGYESIIDAMELGIPASEWAAQIQEVAYEDADLTDEDTQKYLVTENLKNQGLNAQQIEKKLARFESLDTLADEAEEAQALLIKRESNRVAQYNQDVQKEAFNRRKEQQDFIDDINDTIDNTKELNGQYIDRKEAKELKDYINKPVNQRGQTQYMIDRNDPKKLIQIAHLAKNGINLSKLTKQLESKATKSLRDKLDSRTDNNTSGKGKQVQEKITSSKMSQGMPWDRGNYDVED